MEEIWNETIFVLDLLLPMLPSVTIQRMSLWKRLSFKKNGSLVYQHFTMNIWTHEYLTR